MHTGGPADVVGIADAVHLDTAEDLGAARGIVVSCSAVHGGVDPPGGDRIDVYLICGYFNAVAAHMNDSEVIALKTLNMGMSE